MCSFTLLLNVAFQERKNWRRDHPFGFYARPVSNNDGSSNIMKWETGIPGKESTDWEGGKQEINLLKYIKIVDFESFPFL